MSNSAPSALSARSSNIEYSLQKLPKHLRTHPSNRIVLIAEKKAFALHGKTVGDILTRAGRDVALIPFAGGEKNKTPAAAESICRQLLHAKANRKTPVIALGGGVTTDLAGFAASTFMRGVPLLLIPTTLLAQVDAAIGGKNGVNLKEGKNLIGTFYFPEVTIVDNLFLHTLPLREFRCGFAEMIKMSILEGEKFFSEIERLTENGLSPELKLDPLIKRAIQGKIRVVERDPKETGGERASLNLGHTFAHALEAAASYKRYTHGEAVSIGLIAACRLAEEVTGLSSNVTARVKRVLQKCKLPVAFGGVSSKTILERMKTDKKNVGGIRLILPEKLGRLSQKETVPEEKILRVLDGLKEA